MTTSRSPIAALREQAQRIAVALKAAERGEPTGSTLPVAVALARSQPEIKIGVVMDDKTIMITMPWDTIRDTSESGLVEWIVAQMRGETTARPH